MKTPALTSKPSSKRSATAEDPAQYLPEWRRRWRDLQDARAELAHWRELAHEIEASFQRDIAPRERKLTAGLCELTAALIGTFGKNRLPLEDQLLLGKWIMDNLSTLSDHPFADRQQTNKLAARWRHVVSPDAKRKHESALESSTDSQTPRSDASPDHRSATQESPSSPTDNAPEPDASIPEEDIDTKTFVSPLFRRLAQVLHPDKEPDPSKRAVKQELMRQALDARAQGDVDVLLDLYQQHVGEDVNLIDDVDCNALLRAIGKQMEVVQRGLRAIRYGRSLLRLIIDRYGHDPAMRERRLAHHAMRLDEAIKELTLKRQDINSQAGLRQALDKRREEEQDTQLIRELTGATA